jgi:hypothetical protein
MLGLYARAYLAFNLAGSRLKTLFLIPNENHIRRTDVAFLYPVIPLLSNLRNNQITVYIPRQSCRIVNYALVLLYPVNHMSIPWQLRVSFCPVVHLTVCCMTVCQQRLQINRLVV